MDHMASLAKRCQLIESAIARIVIEVRTRQHHRRPGTVLEDVLDWTPHPPPLTVSPVLPLAVPPA